MSHANPSYVRPPPPPKSAQSQSAQPAQTVVVTFPTQSERPAYRAYKYPFKVDGDEQDRFYRPGIYYHFVDEGKDDDGNPIFTLVDYWFLSWLEVLAIVRTLDGTEHGYLIEYIPHGEKTERRLVLPQSSLLGRADDAFKLLRSHGVTVLNKHLKTARSYLDEQHLNFSSAKPEQFWRCTKTVGWHSDKSFLFPNVVIGEALGVCFSGNGYGAAYERSGTYLQWRDNVAALCVGNDYLLLSLSSALAGPLLKDLHIPGSGIHLFGDSTTGKSSALYVGISAWDSPAYMISWRTTTNGLEGHAACRCDTFLAIDESHQAEVKVLDNGVYAILNGIPKGRMNRDASLQGMQSWRIFALSSGERSLESHLGAAHIDHKAGQSVRMLDVPVHAQHGLFDNLHQYAGGRQFAEALVDNCAKYYGHAASRFIKSLINKRSTLDLQAGFTRIHQEFGNNLSAQESRVARVFTLVAMAGELAIEWDIVPWRTGDVTNAAIRVFGYWKNAQPSSAKSREHAQALKRVNDFIDTHGSSRFLDITWKAGIDRFGNVEKEPAVKDRAGYYEDVGGSRIFLFTSAGLRQAIHGLDFGRALRALEEAGAFYIQGTGGEKAKKRNVPDGRDTKLYHIDPAKLSP
jgi:putative DNA primase/helicase